MSIDNYINTNKISIIGKQLSAGWCNAIALNKDQLETISAVMNATPDIVNIKESISHVYYSGLNIATKDYKGRFFSSNPLFSAITNCGARPIGVLSEIPAENSRYEYSVIHGHKVAEYRFPSTTSFSSLPPYTTYQLYLPFLGFIDLDPTPFINSTLVVYLTYNALEGTGVYYIGSFSNSDETSTLYSSHEFTFGIPLTIGTSNFMEAMRNASLSVLTNSLNIAGATDFTPTTYTGRTYTREYNIHGRGLRKGSVMKQIKSGTVTDTDVKVKKTITNPYEVVGTAIESSINVLNKKYGGQTTSTSSNSLIPASAKRVILKKISKRLSPNSEEYKHIFGLPLGDVRKLGTLSGYTKLTSFHIENTGLDTIPEHELSMLHEELMKGIIL